MSVRGKIASGFRVEAGAQLIGVAASGLLLVVLARLLTPSQYGLLYLTISICSIVVLVASFGLSRSAGRYVSTYDESDPAQVPYVVGYSLAFTAGALAVVLVVFLALRGWLADWLEEPGLEPLLVLGAVYIAFYSAVEYCRRVFQGFRRIAYSASIHLLNTVLKFVATILFVAAGLGAVGALAGYVVGLVVTTVVGGVLLSRTLAAYPRADRVEPGLPRRIAEYSLPITLTSSGTVLIKQVDVLLIGLFLNSAAVGYYTVSKQIVQFAEKPANAFGFSIAPRYSEQVTRGNDRHAAELYEEALRGVIVVYAPAAVGLIVVAEPTIRYVFGPSYLEAVPVVQVFAVFLFVHAISHVTAGGLDYLGRARARAALKATIAVCNLLLNLLLIPWLGIIGAAIATVAAYTVDVSGAVYLMDRELPLRWTEVTDEAAKALLIAAAMGAVVSLLVGHATGLLALIAVVACGVAVWGGAALFAGLIEPEDVRSLAGI